MLPTECQYSQYAPRTAYKKGCRCNRCTVSCRKQRRAYYQRNTKKLLEWQRDYNRCHVQERRLQRKKYYQLNSEKVLLKNKDYAQRNPEKIAAYQRRRRYGITQKDYDSLLKNQKGVCAICKGTNKSGRGLGVDHCHTTGKIRGLLCDNCNRGIGFLGEDIKRCREVIDYLSRAANA